MKPLPIIPWQGGKRRLARHILPLFRDHTCYVEPFCGAAALYFLKVPSKTEVINGQSVTRQECTATRYESPCKEPVKSCGNAGNDSQCESNYRSCFVSCGGVIDRYEVK